MAAATQFQFINFTPSPVPTEKRKRRRSMDDVKTQTEHLVFCMVVEFLQREDITVNGFVKRSRDAYTLMQKDPCCCTKEFATARSNLLSACKVMREKNGHELVEMCNKLDISDEQLHSTVRILMSTIWEEPMNWGRLVSLFVVIGVLCTRLHREGHENKIESVLGWFKAYLRDNADPWIRERGGWGSVMYGANLEKLRTRNDCKRTATAAASVGMVAGAVAALGFGIFLGTVIGR